MVEREVDGVHADQVDDVAKGSDDKKPDDDHKEITREELIEQLEAQVKYFDTLPQHQRFSFTTNADLYYFMLIILNILKKDI